MNCQCEVKPNKFVDGYLEVLGSKKLVFQYTEGIFRKKVQQITILYPDILSLDRPDEKKLAIRIAKDASQSKTLVFILPDNNGEELVRTLESIETPDYVAPPVAVRTVRFLFQ